MSDTLPERPSFTDGQYIGAADLNTAVAYARDETRRLALSGQSWGIATGLALVEVTDTTGNVQMFIEPGVAWDGYGRPVVVLSPAPVTPDLFAGLGTGPQPVWLRYTATATQQVTPGFLTCGAGDPTTRVQESYGIVAGNRTVAQQTDGVVIGGVTVADPRGMLVAVDQNASVVLDGSAAQQSFPDDTGVWLIPVGIALYNQGSPGTFSSRQPPQLIASRAARRYIGAIAESVLAADGVLRLRDRQTDNPSTLSDTALAATAAIQQGDVNPDPTNASRLVGNELVWVEGNLRVTGHARLFGTQLELRDLGGQTGGGSLDVPQFLRRAVNPPSNPLGGQDLQICFDRPGDSTGINRLTMGVAAAASPDPPSSATPDGALTELVVVRADGRVAIGTNIIDGYSADANTLVVAMQGNASNTGITVVSGPTNTGNLFFADGTLTPQQKDGFISYDHKAQMMTLGAANATVLSLTATGQAVVGTADPSGFSGDTDQLIVASSSQGAGITIAGSTGTIGSLDFSNGAASPFDAGFIRYNLMSDQMSIGTSGTPQVCIDSAGQVGIGTQAPGGTDPTAQLVVASSTGDAGVTIAAAANATTSLNFGNTGMLPVGGVLYDTSADRMDFQTSENVVVSIDQSGNVGIGTSTPAGQLQVMSPVVAAPYSLVFNTFTVQALLGAAPSPLQLQPQGSSVGIGTATPASLLQIHADKNSPGLIVDSDIGATALWAGAGRVGIGAAGTARTTLDARAAIAGTGAFPAATNHLAILENTETGPGPANVLALVVDTAEATDTECHFVTFYSGTTDIGAIIGGGTAPFNTITYSTFGADYAEAVPRAANVAKIGAKQIVGVHAGQVSLVTEGADAVFVTSESPAMLARRPRGDQQDAYEALAFLGQVHVLVDGPVRAGDLIVASGKADGKGRAVALEKLRPEDVPMIVGRAWGSVDDASNNGVNAIVGPGVATAAAAGVLLARQAGAMEAQARAMEQQARAIERQRTEIERKAREIAGQTAQIEQQASHIERLTAAIAQQADQIERQAAQIKRQASNIERLGARPARRKSSPSE